jgi:putative acetyltransferase
VHGILVDSASLSKKKLTAPIELFISGTLLHLLLFSLICSMKIRAIQQSDNLELAAMIRAVFREFGIDRPGTVYTDPTTDILFSVFQEPGSAYWIAEDDGKIIGGCGIYPTKGLPQGCAELVKFYMAASHRGTGVGRKLMEQSIQSARGLGYSQLYLESFPELNKAVGMYLKAGFRELAKPMGESGHFACTLWMLKDLKE